MRSTCNLASSEGWSGCGPERVRIWRRRAAARHTVIEALEPRPAPMGIVDRSAYRQPGKEGFARDRKM